jgi:protease-4
MVWPFKPKTRKQIARIEITGAIASDTRQRVLKALEIVKERQYPALLLRIDSPGGTVGDSQEIYEALGANYIMANPGTITGSIGVILRGNNLERLLDKVGVSFKVIKSGPYKDILSFDRELTDEEERILQDMIDTSYQQFLQTVAGARNLDVNQVKSFADGRIFTGQQALELGVVDRLGTEEDARLWALELAGLPPDKTKCQTIEEPKPLLSRLTGNRSQIPLGLQKTLQRLEFELEVNGQLLWLYRP